MSAKFTKMYRQKEHMLPHANFTLIKLIQKKERQAGLQTRFGSEIQLPGANPAGCCHPQPNKAAAAVPDVTPTGRQNASPVFLLTAVEVP